jgi:pimeloyl-ACP methyl ester carboxylesterase
MPRSHRNRMWVEGARRLATLGFACFRFDYHGAGDSGGETARVEPNAPYREDALAVIHHLRDRLGERRFVLSGSCFDARTALSAFAGEADAIEGLLFMAAPVMEMDDLVRADADRKDWAHVLGALRKPDNWRSLANPERWKYMATVLGRIANGTLGAQTRAPLPLSTSFLEHFDALVRSRARALFLYGREDREYASFQEVERRLWPRLSEDARRRLAIEVWEGKVHDGILDIRRQREIVDRAAAWIEGFHPRQTPNPPL